jgi:outer membrane biosynthesis protein TonB
MKNNKTKAKLAESLLRRYIQKEIRKIMEADEENTEETPTDTPAEEPKQDPTTAPTPEPKKKEEPKPEPTPEPTPEPEPEVGLNQDFQDAIDQFVQKLKTSTEPVEQEDLVTMVGDLIDMFVQSSEGKLKLLQAVKSNIVQ